ITPRRSSASFGDSVQTFMPGSTGVVHDAGYPRRPSISTRHNRQDPNGSRLTVAHSLGHCMPAVAAASMTELPSGTLTGTPLISRETILPDSLAGVPLSVAVIACIAPSLRNTEIGGEMF